MTLYFCLAFLGLSSGLSAQGFSPAPWLDSAESATMLQEGFLQRTAASLRELPLLSRLPWRQTLVERFSGLDPNVCVEGLFWLPYTEKTVQKAQLRFFQVSQAISQMKGMTYFSKSRNRREVLIQESYRIEGLANRTRLSDLTWNSVPNNVATFLFQHDNTFGRNVYILNVRNTPSQTLFVLDNAERLFWGILPLADPGHLRMVILADFRPEGVLIYGVSGVQTYRVFGLERTREESFFNRLKALADWMLEMF